MEEMVGPDHREDGADLGGGPTELQIRLVASPRNHFNLQ